MKDVTICSIDCITPDLSAEAIKISTKNIDFGDSILFSDRLLSGKFRSIEITPLKSRDDYSRFVIQELLGHIKTKFLLIVQWDGYVTNPRAWTNEFLEYDYIGARWPWHKDGLTVGNGGFSLRSTNLMREVLNLQVGKDCQVNEDELICRLLRPQLETYGIRFAADKVADMFSYERATPEIETFGFHGLFNMWRHCDDSELIKQLEGLNPSTHLSVEYLELMLQYLQQKKFRVYKKLFQLLLNSVGEKSIKDHLAKFIEDAHLIDMILIASLKS
ncbi:hypothetical protein ICN17_09480 [Polynucleobacter sp. 73C-SIWE]|uniref:DUF5672 family protein n=1 Tax=Polynucleobacter sp. 73C-SIWE TaxID=2689098 RepID=UPI001C0B475F|nr:DUF5672 family protein [Polynucleobacter sp. 73C-SIWE]MBU3580229.1 hypothetical protein [Polynucleobacter sp. 73C-SIWE]